MNEQSLEKKFSLKDIFIKYNAILILIILIVVSAILSPVFLTPGNIFNLLRQNMPLLIISMGMLYVILTGGIDLSVGSMAAVGGMVLSMALTSWGLNSGGGLVLSLVLAFVPGIVLGAASGALIAYVRVAPFIVTLAMMTIAKGMAFIFTNGQPVRWPQDTAATSFLISFGKDSALGIPWPVILGIAVFVVFLLITRFTVFGRMIIATGSNETAVNLSGIKAQKYQFSAYVISGCMAVLGGICMTARTGMGTPITGDGYELDAIAACVIGGASLSGGKGKVVNTLIGVMILALITNIMNLMSVPAYPQQIVKGLVIIGAVVLQKVGASNKNTAV